MKIAIFVRDPSELGGIERVVREHVRIFKAHGVDCLVFSHSCSDHVVPLSGRARRDAVCKIMQDFHPDYCILHGITHQGACDDIAVLNELSIPCITVCHFSFPCAMLLEGQECTNLHFLANARQCDMVTPVSEIDTFYWRALGCRAMHVQNPFVHPRPSEYDPSSASQNLQSRPVEILWVGRNEEQKQPHVALATFALVAKEQPNVHLTMIGGSDAGWAGIRSQAKKLGIAGKVSCFGQRDDLNALWDKADIHLLTSVTESFCLVLAEAKAKGIPTAMFEIPFLELVENGRGLVTAQQGDIAGLATKIIDLVKNPDKRHELGEEARASLVPFNDEAVWQSWVRVFEALKTGEGGYDVDHDFKTIVTQEYFAWNRFCDKNLWSIQMVRDTAKLTGGLVTMRGFGRLVRASVRGIQKIKAVLRGK